MTGEFENKYDDWGGKLLEFHKNDSLVDGLSDLYVDGDDLNKEEIKKRSKAPFI